MDCFVATLPRNDDAACGGVRSGRDWAKKIRMRDDIVERVTARWADYGLPGVGQPIWR